MPKITRRLALVLLPALLFVTAGCGTSLGIGSLGGTIRVTVRNLNVQGNNGVSGVSVTAVLGGVPPITGVTDAQGVVVFNDLGAGEYMVSITVPSGYTLDAGEVREKTVLLEMNTQDIPFRLRSNAAQTFEGR